MSGNTSERSGASRRGFLVATGSGLLATACSPSPTRSGAPATTAGPPRVAPPPPLPPVGPSELLRFRHLANRATFGATSAVIDRMRRIGTDAWLDEQLDPRGLATAEARVAGFATLRNDNSANDQIRSTDENRIFAELDHATLLRAVHSPRQLYEVMCDFWTNHLNISRQAKWLTQLKTVDNETVVRPHALGKFSDLLMASAKSPAMLVYLDNFASDALAPSGVNENYGRELLELHTLGILNGSQVYTEQDVLGVAKVLSGWTINWDEGPQKYTFRFGHWMHSREAVSILGGAWSRPARPRWGDYDVHGQSDGESLLRFLARHPSTARNISFKLVRRFVSDDPPMPLVERLASVYTANDTAIVPVLRELFRSREFASSAGLKVKRPWDWFCSTLRVTAAQFSDNATGHGAEKLRSASRLLGQPLFDRPSPDGWPDRSAVWSSAQGLLKRWELAGQLTRNAVSDPGATDRIVVDVRSLLPSPLPSSAGGLVTSLAENVVHISVADADVESICSAIGVAVTASSSRIAGDAAAASTVLALLLSHPRFQYR